MTKLQITLTDQEVDLLAEKAANLGYDVTKYAKFILAQQALEQLNAVPTFKASSKMEKILKQALQDDKDGKSIEYKLEHGN